LLLESSVPRNFALMDLMEVLSALTGGRLRFVHGVLSQDAQETCELSVIQEAIARQLLTEAAGSARYSRLLRGSEALVRVIDGTHACDVLQLGPAEFALASLLTDPSPQDRRRFGMRHRRLGTGEAVTIAVGVKLREPIATDDADARAVFQALGGVGPLWTLDLLKLAVEQNLVVAGEAQYRYRVLVEEDGFRGIAWE
jgi:hypothetical protein